MIIALLNIYRLSQLTMLFLKALFTNSINAFDVHFNVWMPNFYCRIDDIEDNSILRRGIPVAHSIYGVASTINTANYTIFMAMELAQKLDHPDVSFFFVLNLILFTDFRFIYRLPKFAPNSYWNCTEVRGWKFIGETIFCVPRNLNTSWWLLEKLEVFLCWPFA